MRKTLLLTHEYFPFKGGVARYCFNLFKHFDVKDYLVVTDHKGVTSEGNIIKMQIKSLVLRPTWLFSFFRIKNIVKKNGIRVVFTPNILPLGTIAYFLKRTAGIPYIISLHGLDIRLAIQNKPRLAKKILDNAEKIIVNSLSTKKNLQDLGIYQNKVHLLYPTAEPRHPQPEAVGKLRRSSHIDNEAKILLTVGRLTARKGHALVLKAVAEMRREHKLHYLIVGQGVEHNFLERLAAKLEIMDCVSFLTNVGDDELPNYYALADIFVMPNKEWKDNIEGFGIVYLEAAMQGLPIIAGRSGGPAEIFTDSQNALLVSGEDLASLKAALTRLLNNPDYAGKLAAAALERAKEFANSSTQSRRLAELL